MFVKDDHICYTTQELEKRFGFAFEPSGRALVYRGRRYERETHTYTFVIPNFGHYASQNTKVGDFCRSHADAGTWRQELTSGAWILDDPGDWLEIISLRNGGTLAWDIYICE